MSKRTATIKHHFMNSCKSGNVLHWEVTFIARDGKLVDVKKTRGWWQRTPSKRDKVESEFWEVLISDHLKELFGELAERL